MSSKKETRRPGDIILDHYIPHASNEKREEARENLRRLGRLLIRVHERLARENPQSTIRTIAEPELESESLPHEL